MFLNSGTLGTWGESVLYCAHLISAQTNVQNPWAHNVRSFPVTEKLQTRAPLEQEPGEEVPCPGKASLLQE